jgi:hypothetical protein
MSDNLILSNMLHRPARTFVSVLGIGVGVMLIVFTTGLARGTLHENAQREANVGAEIIRPALAERTPFVCQSAAPMKSLKSKASKPRFQSGKTSFPRKTQISAAVWLTAFCLKNMRMSPG